jgi:hypothetical protein
VKRESKPAVGDADTAATMTTGLLALGLVFGCFAGALAFLIAYEESGRHFTNKRAARRHALGTALGALAFFGGLAVLLVLIIPHVLHS